MGLVNIYNFLSGHDREYDETLPIEIANAFADGDPIAARTFAIFVDIYGAEAGNMALRLLARGGVFLAGGVAAKNIDRCSGEAFNIGGGAQSTISLLELLKMIQKLEGRMPHVEWSDWRVGDQRYYVSDTRRFERVTGWRPSVAPRDGVRRLREWLVAAGVPALVQEAEEKPVRRPVRAVRVARGADVPVAAIPMSE